MSCTTPQSYHRLAEDALEFARVVRAVQCCPEHSRERAAARAAKDVARDAGRPSMEQATAGYDAGVTVLLEPLEQSSRDLVRSAIQTFGRDKIEVVKK